MSQKRARRKYSSDEKAAILRRHLVDKKPVSDVCDEYGIRPSVFYTWQRQLIENIPMALDVGGQRRHSNSREERLAQKVELLEAKLAKKDNVIAEVTEEFVR